MRDTRRATTTAYGYGSRHDWALKIDGTTGEYLNIKMLNIQMVLLMNDIV